MYDRRRHQHSAVVFIALVAALAVIAVPAFAQSVLQATLAETNQKTPEANTATVQRALADGSAILVDSRKRAEYVPAHIPLATNPNSVPHILTPVRAHHDNPLLP